MGWIVGLNVGGEVKPTNNGRCVDGDRYCHYVRMVRIEAAIGC